MAEALVAVLEHNGVAVYVHPGQKQAGMASIACGALEHARKLAEHNVAILAESVRQGYHIVATEPAAALCLTHEYPQLIDDDDARLVAANSSEACSFLWKMHTLGQLQLDFHPLNMTLGYHTPCHLRALARRLARREPAGLDPRPAAASHRGRLFRHGRRLRAACTKTIAAVCGRAEARFRGSAIRPSRPASPNAAPAKCKWSKAPSKPTLHPVKLLALAYGLVKEIEGVGNMKSPFPFGERVRVNTVQLSTASNRCWGGSCTATPEFTDVFLGWQYNCHPNMALN